MHHIQTPTNLKILEITMMFKKGFQKKREEHKQRCTRLFSYLWWAFFRQGFMMCIPCPFQYVCAMALFQETGQSNFLTCIRKLIVQQMDQLTMRFLYRLVYIILSRLQSMLLQFCQKIVTECPELDKFACSCFVFDLNKKQETIVSCSLPKKIHSF